MYAKYTNKYRYRKPNTHYIMKINIYVYVFTYEYVLVIVYNVRAHVIARIIF